MIRSKLKTFCLNKAKIPYSLYQLISLCSPWGPCLYQCSRPANLTDGSRGGHKCQPPAEWQWDNKHKPISTNWVEISTKWKTIPHFIHCGMLAPNLETFSVFLQLRGVFKSFLRGLFWVVRWGLERCIDLGNCFLISDDHSFYNNSQYSLTTFTLYPLEIISTSVRSIC